MANVLNLSLMLKGFFTSQQPAQSL